MQTTPQHWHIGLVGYGEVGRILAEDLRAQGVTVSAYDIKLDSPASAAPLQAHAAQHGVQLASSGAALAAQADFIISAVTASQTVGVAQACAPALQLGAYFLDFNSASPGAKQRAASLIDGAGGRYVEGAVMTSVPPHRIKVPLLLGGTFAAELAPLINSLGFAAKVTSDQLGVASATKMCRSVMIKGLESLLSESLLAARHYGVERDVLQSLQNLLPATDWSQLSRYMISRSLLHGQRRCEEMREAARSVQETGIDPLMSNAIALRQEWTASLGVDPAIPTLEAMLDAMLRSRGELRC